MVTVQLPAQFKAEKLFPFIMEKFGTFENVPSAVTFDFAALRFIRPSGVVFLSNLTRYLGQRGCEVEYSGLDLGKDPIKFLDDSRFFEVHLDQKLSPDSQPRETTQPLVELRHEFSHAWTHNTLAPWLSNIAGVPIAGLAELQTIMSELFNNIKDHSDNDVGSVFAQWYPNEKCLQVAVADFGLGIPETVRRVEGHLSDAEAIVRAFEEGFSAQSTPQNRGQGLYQLRQYVLECLGGSLTVRSHKGAVGFEKSGNSVRIMPYDALGFCPGTMIEFNIRTDLIEVEDEGSGDFEW